MTRDVAKDKPDAITIICTNLKAAPSVAKLERETGIQSMTPLLPWCGSASGSPG
jgi:maleate cis-trans isomerase